MTTQVVTSSDFVNRRFVHGMIGCRVQSAVANHRALTFKNLDAAIKCKTDSRGSVILHHLPTICRETPTAFARSACDAFASRIASLSLPPNVCIFPPTACCWDSIVRGKRSNCNAGMFHTHDLRHPKSLTNDGRHSPVKKNFARLSLSTQHNLVAGDCHA